MPPSGVKTPGEELKNPAEGLIRRGYRTGKQKYVIDQKTGEYRLPAAALEPRLPQNRPDAKNTDKYLSVNILSSLQAANMPQAWEGNNDKFYSAILCVKACFEQDLKVTWEPVDQNPHHGGIWGLAERFSEDFDAYHATLTALSKATIVLPECIR